ncbi:hypothetical protein TUM12370_13520 [Salmonella enterica subsp. enterica serovar Choleraesuis]|nr:hypothetical protein TUM12370_13520 [Salmonella enterica subsp. enterica serovar Choleraesuis]
MSLNMMPLSNYENNLSAGCQDIILAIEAGLLAEHGSLDKRDVAAELLFWLDDNPYNVLRDIYAQALDYTIGDEYHPTLAS